MPTSPATTTTETRDQERDLSAAVYRARSDLRRAQAKAKRSIARARVAVLKAETAFETWATRGANSAVPS